MNSYPATIPTGLPKLLLLLALGNKDKTNQNQYPGDKEFPEMEFEPPEKAVEEGKIKIIHQEQATQNNQYNTNNQ